LKGFYVAPYFGYMSAQDEDMSASDDEGFNYVGNLKMNYIGGGIQLGWQFTFAEIIVIDWNFLGIGGGILDLEGGYTSSRTGDNLDGIENDIIDFFENDIEIAKPEYTIAQSGNGISLDMKSPIGLLRTGLSLGIAF